MLSGKLAASRPPASEPVCIHPGSTAPMRPATQPATAAAGVMRFHRPSSTGTTAVAQSRSAIRNRRSTDNPCNATNTTGTISPTVTQRAADRENPRRLVATSEAMPFCRVSTDEATSASASSKAGSASQPGASVSRAKKGMGGCPKGLPEAAARMPRAPTRSTTSTVAMPPIQAPRRKAESLAAAQTRCQYPW